MLVKKKGGKMEKPKKEKIQYWCNACGYWDNENHLHRSHETIKRKKINGKYYIAVGMGDNYFDPETRAIKEE